MSLASVVSVAEALNHGHEFDAFALNVIYKRLPARIKREVIEPYVSIADDEARISLRVRDSLPDLRRQALLDEIHQVLRKEFGLSRREYTVTGLLVLYNNMLQSLYESQIKSVGWSLLGVLLALWWLFRNLRAAAVGVIPNAVAAASVLGLMGWVGIRLDMMTIMLAAISMGIAVEDCIHYLYRFRLEYRRLGDARSAMYHCHASIARAGFYTTLVVTFGFSILVFSNFIPTILFGALTAIAMTVAVIAALTLMPMMLLKWNPFVDRHDRATLPPGTLQGPLAPDMPVPPAP
jgi:predicted RND superfamily exporter protein